MSTPMPQTPGLGRIQRPNPAQETRSSATERGKP